MEIAERADKCLISNDFSAVLHKFVKCNKNKRRGATPRWLERGDENRKARMRRGERVIGKKVRLHNRCYASKWNHVHRYTHFNEFGQSLDANTESNPRRTLPPNCQVNYLRNDRNNLLCNYIYFMQRCLLFL